MSTIPNLLNKIATQIPTTFGKYFYKPGLPGGQTAIGGTGVTDILKLQGTSGNGTVTAPAIQAQVGNNGATLAYTVLNNGYVGVGTVTPATRFELYGTESTDILRSHVGLDLINVAQPTTMSGVAS